MELDYSFIHLPISIVKINCVSAVPIRVSCERYAGAFAKTRGITDRPSPELDGPGRAANFPLCRDFTLKLLREIGASAEALGRREWRGAKRPARRP